MTTAQQTTAKLSIVCPVDALLEATAKLLSVVPSKSPKPVLSNILFRVRDGVLELSGTDMVCGIHYTVPAAQIVEEGSGLLNGIRFSELLKEFRGVDAKIQFNARGGCVFKAKGGRYKVNGDDVRDYPRTKRFEDKPGIAITGAELIEMVKKTQFAAAPEESRLTINGVLFELVGSRLRLVATDNKRMSITEREVPAGTADFNVSVPMNFLKALLKVCSKDVAGKPAVLGVDGTKVFFRLPSATVYSTVLQGNYPPYEEGLTIKLDYHIDCSVIELLSTLRRSILVNDSLAAFVWENGGLSLHGTSTAVGIGQAVMPVELELPEGVEKVRVGFNPAYFREALEAMTAKKCRFMFQGPRNAGVLKEILPKDDGGEEVSNRFVYAVMPALLPREA